MLIESHYYQYNTLLSIIIKDHRYTSMAFDCKLPVIEWPVLYVANHNTHTILDE